MKNKKKLTPKKVFDLVSKIPPGSVTTYKEIAIALGAPLNSRVVGNILSQNTDLISVPCHRVIRSDGFLGGYVKGSREKKRLLEEEGVVFVSETRIDLKDHFIKLK